MNPGLHLFQRIRNIYIHKNIINIIYREIETHIYTIYIYTYIQSGLEKKITPIDRETGVSRHNRG